MPEKDNSEQDFKKVKSTEASGGACHLQLTLWKPGSKHLHGSNNFQWEAKTIFREREKCPPKRPEKIPVLHALIHIYHILTHIGNDLLDSRSGTKAEVQYKRPMQWLSTSTNPCWFHGKKVKMLEPKWEGSTFLERENATLCPHYNADLHIYIIYIINKCTIGILCIYVTVHIKIWPQRGTHQKKCFALKPSSGARHL